MIDFDPAIIVFAVAPLFPIGLVVIAVGIRWKRETALAVGSFLAMLSIVPFAVMSPFYLWQIVWARGWDLRLEVEIEDYTVTLVQEPGSDFYESYFEFVNHEGKTARVWIDSDDYRWWNPDIVREDGKIYFTRDLGQIGDHTSYLDPENEIAFAGYHRRVHKFEDLEFD